MRTASIASLGSVFLLLWFKPVAADPPCDLPTPQILKPSSSSSSSGNGFGTSVATDGNTAVVGFPAAYRGFSGSGLVSVYSFDGTQWHFETSQLPIENPIRFGTRVAVRGDVVAASGTNSIAYVYRRASGAWTLEKQIGFLFDGTSNPTPIALGEDLLIAGFPAHDTSSGDSAGVVLVYQYAGTSWNSEAQISSPTAHADERYGYWVALRDETAFISTSSGTAVYVFQRSGGTWPLVQTITPPHPIGAIAADGETLALGSPSDSTSCSAFPYQTTECGAVYVYKEDVTGWTHNQTLTTWGTGFRHFGRVVDVKGGVLAVGYDNSIPFGSNRAFTFRDQGAMWGPAEELSPPTGQGVYAFGASVAISGDSVLVGAPSTSPRGAVIVVSAHGDCDANGIWDQCDIQSGTSLDCNGNGAPDQCEYDCQHNGVPDDCDVASGTSPDCNHNIIPDECEPDCQHNGVPDDCDVASGGSPDCNSNGTPDECETDCQYNGVPDDCDILSGTSTDCNTNGIPDECETDCQPNGVPDDCDIRDHTSTDCDGNHVPDECQARTDCNSNGTNDICDIYLSHTSADCNYNKIPDECDIASGTSEDCSSNGIPDDCERDFDGDGIPASCEDFSFCQDPDCPAPGPCLSIKAIAINDIGFRPTTDVTLNPGDRLTTRIYISCWGTEDVLLRAYQFQLKIIDGATSGTQGVIMRLGYDLPNPTIPCQTYADCPVGSICIGCASCRKACVGVAADPDLGTFIDPTNPLYVFFGVESISVVNTVRLDPLYGATSYPDYEARDTGIPRYAGNLKLQASSDAWGTFTFGIYQSDETFLVDSAQPGHNFYPTRLTPLTIHVYRPDCNNNGIPDALDIANGTSQDCDHNVQPDECQPDCQGNGVADACDIASGISQDIDGNGIPDECLPIPALSTWGMCALAIVLLIGAKIRFPNRIRNSEMR